MHQRVRQFIAFLEIAGGFAGIALTSTLVWSSGVNLRQAIIIGLSGLPFLASFYAGQALWRDLPKGYAWSALVQAVQIPAWSSPGLLYVFYSGGQLGMWFTQGSPQPLAGIGSHLTLSWAADVARANAFGLNVVALWAFLQLVLGRPRSVIVAPQASADAPA